MRTGCTCDRGPRGVPYDKTIHCPACWSFWHRPEVNAARGGTGVVDVKQAPTVSQVYSGCIYRGQPTGETKECKTCSGKVPVPLYVCDKLGGECYTGNYNVPGARACNSCPHKTSYDPEDPKVAVVVGSYLWPSLVEMQIKLIRRTCGKHVPILVTDDGSDTDGLKAAICKKYEVEFLTTESRIGHIGGDLLAFYHGIEFARKRGCRVLAKVSQRLFLSRVRWLQIGAKELLDSGLPFATRKCVSTKPRQSFPIRTEVCLLDVEASWDMDALKPRTVNPEPKVQYVTGEDLIYNLIPGGIYWPWSELADDRFLYRPNEVNHWKDKRPVYEKLARELNVRLDPKFHANGWEAEHARGEYLYG